MDAESARWIAELEDASPGREAACRRLRDFLLRIVWKEAERRRERLPGTVIQDLEDICQHAASDAMMAILRKRTAFQGRARFTSWAAKFAILEVSAALRRRTWAGRALHADPGILEHVTDCRPSALAAIQSRETLQALRDAVTHSLTEHQRDVFLSAAVQEMPIDVLAERLGCSRGAVYKTLHEARRRLRHELALSGHGVRIG